MTARQELTYDLPMNLFPFLFSQFARLSHFLFRRPRLFLFLSAALFIGIGISTVYRGGFSEHQRTDFSVFVRAAEAVQAGDNIYDVKTVRHWNYVYLPLLALLAVPFTYLPFAASVLIWYVLSVAAMAAVFWMASRLGENARDGFFAALTSFILVFPAFLGTLSRGQMGIISILIALAVFWLYLRKHDTAAGLLLAFGIVLKTSPLAALIFFFLFRRNWRVLTACAFGGLFFVLILPSLFVGVEKNLFWLSEYFRITSHAVSDKGYEGILWQQLVTPFAEDNQSAYAVLTRLFWGSEAAYIGHSNEGIRWITRAFAALVLAAGAAAALRNPRRAPAKRLLLEYSLYPMLMLWVSPVTQNHHYTALYLPFLAAALYLSGSEEDAAGSKKKTLLQAGLLIAGLFFLAGLVSDSLAWWGLPVWGSLLGIAMILKGTVYRWDK